MKQLNECGCNSEMDHSNTDNYMFFQNLKTIKKMVDAMLKMDPKHVDQILSNGHGWAADHIATSKDDVEEVGGFLMNSEQTEIGHMPNDVAYNTQPQFVPVTLDSPEKMKGFIREIIRKVKGGYRLYSKKKTDGKRKNLGTFPSKSAAEKHDRQVQYFKNK
jgi:hypothetical protein